MQRDGTIQLTPPSSQPTLYSAMETKHTCLLILVLPKALAVNGISQLEVVNRKVGRKKLNCELLSMKDKE